MNELNLDRWAVGGAEPAKGDPYLVGAIAHFATHDDNKDNTTWLEGFVNIYRDANPILAAYMEQRDVEFRDRSQHNIPLRIENNRLYKQDLHLSQFLVRITIPHGQDENWNFNVAIDLVLSDASLYGASASNVSLNNANRELVIPIR